MKKLFKIVIQGNTLNVVAQDIQRITEVYDPTSIEQVEEKVMVLADREKENELSVLDTRCLDYIRTGHKLAAVKLYKEETGLGLKEAKEHCDILDTKFCDLPLHARHEPIDVVD